MKILYCTDIHDALQELKELLQTTQADLYLFSGDILYKAFRDDETIYRFVSLQEEFYSLDKRREEKFYPFDLSQDILRFPEKYNNNRALLDRAAEYRSLFNQASRNMKEKYELIAELIDRHGQAECYLLPGNYDLDFRYTALQERDLHRKMFRFQNLTIAGYGGAPVSTSGIPEKLAVVFHETKDPGHYYSEPEAFFEEKRPDILALHCPAYGYFDRIPTRGHVGSIGIRNYIDHHAPRLVVSGHVHEDYGIARRHNGTVLLNPSNFGAVDSPSGWKTGGTFAEIFWEEDRIVRVELKRLNDSRIYPLAEYNLHGDAIEQRLADRADHSNLDLAGFLRDPGGAPLIE